jgi:hypothetical protein
LFQCCSSRGWVARWWQNWFHSSSHQIAPRCCGCSVSQRPVCGASWRRNRVSSRICRWVFSWEKMVHYMNSCEEEKNS